MGTFWALQAIETKYAGPTNANGSRVIVRAEAGRMIVPWDHALDPADNHLRAARLFAEKWGWGGTWYGGAAPGSRGYVFVCANREGARVRLSERGFRFSAKKGA